MKIQYRDSVCKIKDVAITSERITGRGGLSLFLRYLEKSNLFSLLESVFKSLRKSRKGKSVSFILRQIMVFMMDGTSRAISHFDILQKDEGYAAALEVKQERLLSSHSVKRYFKKFTSLGLSKLYRNVLNTLFIWRLKIEKPDRIVLDIDTMVLDNSSSKVRYGVKPTYKKGVKGFQNLQITWNGRVVDAIFRNGSSHSNHGNDVKTSFKRIVHLIRKNYREDVEIIITLDSGFFSEENYNFFDTVLKVYFVGVGKMYSDLKEYLSQIPQEYYNEYSNKQNVWHYVELGDRRRNWKECGFLRAIYTRFITDDNGQVLMEFSRPDTILYTNMGCSSFDKQSEKEVLFSAEEIISLAHGRGNSELVNRSFKEFMVKETLPFKNFGMNAAYYYIMAITHFCFVSFKIDNLEIVECIDKNAMPNTFRRKIIDFAAKIVKKGNNIILKVSRSVWEGINFEALWVAVNKVPLVTIPLNCY
jgi:hypothetical protein